MRCTGAEREGEQRRCRGDGRALPVTHRRAREGVKEWKGGEKEGGREEGGESARKGEPEGGSEGARERGSEGELSERNLWWGFGCSLLCVRSASARMRERGREGGDLEGERDRSEGRVRERNGLRVRATSGAAGEPPFHGHVSF